MNLGLGGLCLVGHHKLEVGHELTVCPTEEGWEGVTARVVWTVGDETGLVYAGPLEKLEHSWVKKALQQLGFESLDLYERRRYVRAPADVAARLKNGEVEYPCVLKDLGLGGALVQTKKPAPLEPGTRVQLQMESDLDDPLPARLAYRRKDLLGLCFEPDRLTRSQLRLLQGYLRSQE